MRSAWHRLVERCKPTMLSTLRTTLSKYEPTFFATDLTSNGSNFAESSSFAATRHRVDASVVPGGEREPPENACVTVSFSLLAERERYCVSRLAKERRTRIVSGLRQCEFCGPRRRQDGLPLLRVGVYCVRMDSDSAEELVEHPQELGVSSHQSLLEKRRSWTSCQSGLINTQLKRTLRGIPEVLV